MEYFIANITSSCVNNFLSLGSPSEPKVWGETGKSTHADT